jgi:hypothetical protein
MPTLPLFALGPSLVTEDKVLRVIAPALGVDPARRRGNADYLIIEDGPLRIDADFRIGRLWFADRCALWNPRRVPKPADLPDDVTATARAHQWLAALELTPAGIPASTHVVQWINSTRAAYWDVAAGRRDPHAITRLDKHVSFALAVEIDDPLSGARGWVSAFGLGAKAGVTFGDGDRPIGLSCTWRPIVERRDERELQPKPDGPFFKQPMLGYRAGLADGVLQLVPVWVYAPQTADDNARAKFVSVPAIQGEAPAPWTPTPSLPAAASPLALEQEGMAPAPAAGVSASPDPDLRSTNVNIERFKRIIRATGWRVALDVADTDEKSEWEGSTAKIDSVNLLFYAGHASNGGWYLDEDLKVLVGRGSPYGSVLDWIAVSACGPLQDVVATGGFSDVFEWRKVFRGLRMLLGFGNEIADAGDEGEYFVAHARLGIPVKEAWFRMAVDVQSSFGGLQQTIDLAPVWVAALYPEGDGASRPAEDLLWGTGKPLSPRPTGSPRHFIAVLAPA